MPSVLSLHAGHWRCEIRPDLGGSIANLWYRDSAVLRPTDAATLASVRDSACYPLVPYSNRIALRRFHWEGEAVQLAPNFPDSPHSLHGVGWQRNWAVLSHTDTSLALRYAHTPDADWPYAFAAEQRYTVAEAGLRCELQVQNTDPRTQPMGLGWHPYFPLLEHCHLRTHVDSRWDMGTDMLPTGVRPHAPIDDAVQALDWDHCFGGWDGAASLHSPRIQVNLTSSLGYLVVFTPPHRRFFCVEPVSHVNNAVNSPAPNQLGLHSLMPGATLQAHMELRCQDHP